nr:nuclease-related domain-containing protein [uncultured Methanoregula sp.]
MAKIYGISGSTRYLLKGTRPINGKKPVTLDEIHHFHTNYEKILAETQDLTGKMQDQLISDLHDQESLLDQRIKKGVAERTLEVHRHILEINQNVEESQNFFWKAGYKLQFWGACWLSSYRIHHPSVHDVNSLEQIRYHRRQTIANRDRVIQNECWNVMANHKFLNENEPFLIGAQGEEHVIKILSGLPDDFHILNDVNLRFQDYIFWRKHREYIKTCQIDHIVIGPTGLFLLETKNWKRSDIQDKAGDLTHQVNRANYALWYWLKDNYWRNGMPKIRQVVISLHGSPVFQPSDAFIDVIAPGRLCNYITNRESKLSDDDIHNLIRNIPCRDAI